MKKDEFRVTYCRNRKNTKDMLDKQTKDIKITFEETLEEIQGTEGKIVSHVLILMGVRCYYDYFIESSYI